MAKVRAAIVAYVPVLHQGYLNFFQRHLDASTLFLIDNNDLLLEKDIRAVPAEQMKSAIEALRLFETVEVLHVPQDKEKLSDFEEWILPDDEVMRTLVKNYFPSGATRWDTTFLRWDSVQSLAKKSVEPDGEVTNDQLHQTFMSKAAELSERSADWWRQIGGVLVVNGEVILEAYNRHVPNELEPYYHGDPRANFHKGEHIELSTALHAEQALIAQAAKKGISLAGADLYVTTFPCPNCAKLVAYSGISRVFFKDGYSMVDGAEVMRSQGIELIKVTES